LGIDLYYISTVIILEKTKITCFCAIIDKIAKKTDRSPHPPEKGRMSDNFARSLMPRKVPSIIL
jgi:hypothetical protein